MTSDPASVHDMEALHAQGCVPGDRHRRLLQEANTALSASPAPGLLECVQTIHHVLLSADPKALRRSVSWFGRLLGRDITLQAKSDALRSQLGVHVLQARQQLETLMTNDRLLQALGLAMHAAIEDLGQQSTLLADRVGRTEATEPTRQLQYLATLAASLRISASHLDLTLLNHRELIQRVEQMLPRVELLLDQQHMLRAGHAEQTALQAATRSLEALQVFERANVTEGVPQIDTPQDATSR